MVLRPLIALVIAAFAARAAVVSAQARSVPDAFPGVSAAYAVERDGRVLWSSRADEPLPPASLTKLMTALLVVEDGPLARRARVPARAARADGARVPLRAGESLTRGDLLTALLLRSGNDACLVLAESVAGTEAAFVARMNARAASLGLAHTHFENACGFDAPGHRASAADLLALAHAALAQPAIAARVGLAEASIGDGASARTIATTNALLGRVPGAAGVKTGYTRAAGHCLVGLVERDGVRVIVVLLGAKDRWWDAVAMIERAFDAGRTVPRRE